MKKDKNIKFMDVGDSVWTNQGAKGYGDHVNENERSVEKKQNMGGSGYCSAYIPTGTVKNAGAQGLTSYLGTHKKLFDHKHNRGLRIGFNEF